MSLKYFLVLSLWICCVTLSNCTTSEPFKCIVCDSETADGDKCIANSNNPCKVEGSVELIPDSKQCFTYKKGSVVKRGYVTTESICVKNDNDCKLCPSDAGKEENPCNADCIYTTCLQCESSKDGKCLDGTSETVCNSTNLACQQCFDEATSILTRKCGKSSSLTCGTCFTGKCNDGLTCYECTSGENCAASNGQANIFPKGGQGCFIKLNSAGQTERGYLAKGDSCEEVQKCRRTEGHLSNTGTFAADHLKCYQCSGDKTCDAEQSTEENLKNCEYYVPGDYCYIEKVDDKIYRGCGSDKNREDICKTDKCRRCSENGCNSMKSTYLPKLKCITCDEADEKCVLGSASSEAKQCDSLLQFYQDEFCYARMINEQKVKRGCGFKDAVTDCNTTKCDHCTTDGCNNKNYFKQTCARCRDDDGAYKANCTADGKAYIGDPCPKADDITPDTKGCYVMRYDGVIYRGCIIDLSIDDMHLCLKNDTNDCRTCPGVDCNTFKLPNGSPHSAEIGFATLLLAIAALFNMKMF